MGMGGYPCPYDDNGTCIPASSETDRLVVVRNGDLSLITGDLVETVGSRLGHGTEALRTGGDASWLQSAVKEFAYKFLDLRERLPRLSVEGAPADNWVFIPCQPCNHWAKVPQD